MKVIFVIGIFLSFFIQFLLITKKGKTLPDKVLTLWMFFIGIHLFSYYLYYLGYWTKYPHMVGITLPFPLLHGPMLFLYVVFSLRKDQHVRWKDYLHFAPVVISYLYLTKFFFFYSAEQKALLDQGKINDFTVFSNISLIAFIVSGLVYPIVAYRLLDRYQNLINQNFSYEIRIELRWLKNCIWGIGAIYVISGVIILLKEVFKVEFGFNTDLIIYSTIIVFVFYIGYSGIRHQGIFTEETTDNSQIAEPKPIGEYKKSGLKQDDAEVYHEKLLIIMAEKKPYLEPKLTLSALANELGVSINHLSQIINQFQEKNFYDFINEYRIREFKQKISNPKNRNFNILAIAFESGFNSKSAFNQIFKKHTGKTPSQYLTEIIHEGNNSNSR